jgi:hypothetical protein
MAHSKGNFVGGHRLMLIFAAGHYSFEHLLLDTLQVWKLAITHFE